MSDRNEVVASSVDPVAHRPAPRRTKQLICGHEKCINPIAKIVGDCRWCSSRFCLKHRLPETHVCPNIATCRAQASDDLAKRLLEEKCVSNKV